MAILPLMSNCGIGYRWEKFCWYRQFVLDFTAKLCGGDVKLLWQWLATEIVGNN
jgi:hypothetical protein